MAADPNQPPPPSRGVLAWLGENAFGLAIIILVFIVIAVLAFGLLSGTTGILDDISRTDTARGLITFIFAFGVISIAFILIISLFFSKAPDILEKFEKAKEVFTALIVILGTIMGFYFGVEVASQPTEVLADVLVEETDDAVGGPDEPVEVPDGPAETPDGPSEPREPTTNEAPESTAPPTEVN